MTSIYYIFILFCILFLIEVKAVNILINYVAILVAVAFIIPYINIYPITLGGIGVGGLGTIGGEYIAYIIILVQVSALTILFGFIIMLYPSLSLSVPIDSNRTTQNIYSVKERNYKYVLIVITSIIIYTSYYNSYIYIELLELLSPKGLNMNIAVANLGLDNNIKDTPLYYYLENSFLRKLGTYIYYNNIFSIKLILITLILLLAIVILFFFLSPSF